jgi:hypothetical protein
MRSIILSFILLCFLTISLGFLHQNTLNLRALQLDEFSKTLSQKELNAGVSLSVPNIHFPIMIDVFKIFCKTILIASLLYFGAFVFDLKIKFKTLLDATIKSEYIFILPILYEIIYFKFVYVNHTISDIKYFYAGSILNLLNYKNVDPWFIYLFQTLNLFELAYWLVLAYFIGKFSGTNMDKGLKIVAYSYGPALLLWVVGIMFVTLNYS